MTICIKPNGTYPNKPFKALAAKAWNEFFAIADETCDVAHWRISAHSATVRLSPRTSSIDESDPDLVSTERIHILVEGIIEVFKTLPDGDPRLDKAIASFRAWAEKGILDAFESARIAKKFERFNPDEKNFAVVSADTDWGLHEDELSLLWTNNARFTVARIKSRQSAAAKKRKAAGKRRGQRLRKKSPKTLKKEGRLR